MISVLSRSLYWRIALGFILCIAGVLTMQTLVVFALLNRTQAINETLTQSASLALGRAIATDPHRDLQQFFGERFAAPPESLFAVMTSGQVLRTGEEAPSDRVIETAVKEFEHSPVRSLPRGWQGDPFHASAIVVNGEIVGAVAIVPRTWVARLGPALLGSSLGLLIVGTALSSIFIFGPAHRRLKELQLVALALGAGDLSVRAREKGGDEVAQVARAFNQMAANLSASDRARRLLLADVSHELMTPLTAVRGYQQRLVADPLIVASESLARSVTVIGDETERVERIVGDLLDLAKLEGGADALDLEDVSIEGLFGRVAARHAPQASAKALNVSTTIAPGAELVFGDRFRLEQALQNLAANAIRHSPQHGRVELRAELRDSGTTLSVADQGPGIAPEHIAFVFDRFYKADSSRSGESGGSGLGLSIVHAIVERHGGHVTVSSEPGAQTVFSIWLPPPDLTSTRSP